MWHEIEGRKTHTKDGKPQLKITRERILKPGDEVILYQRKRKILSRKTTSTVRVSIVDNDRSKVIAQILEPSIQAGSFMAFPIGTERSDSDDQTKSEILDVTRQNIKIQTGNKVRGVLWTNEMGIKPKPSSSRLGRDFYETDTDPEALETRQKLAHWNKMAAEGKIRGGAGGAGI